jgi:predicted RNase H-like HicB family nuclease
MLTYPVHLSPTRGGGVRLTFPDLPQALCEGCDEADALFRARFVLEMALAHLLDHGQRPPEPSVIAGAPTVSTAKFGAPIAA